MTLLPFWVIPEVQSDTLKNIEAIYNELSDSSLNGMLGKFFSSIQDMSTSPELISTKIPTIARCSEPGYF